MNAHPESYGHWDHEQISALLHERDALRRDAERCIAAWEHHCNSVDAHNVELANGRMVSSTDCGYLDFVDSVADLKTALAAMQRGKEQSNG